MDRIVIEGGVPLQGEVQIAGSKNAALPIMAASLLTGEKVTFENVPFLADITTMAHLLVCFGADLTVDGLQTGSGRTITLDCAEISSVTAPYDIVRKMRASVVVLGPLLARMGKAEVSLPGGCAIGLRPINFHLDALERMGAEIRLDGGYVRAKAPAGLHGAVINFPQVSVGATENIMMAATLARGTTVLENAAREPEVCDLAHCLNQMGAKISGIGSSTITIEGAETLHGTRYKVLPDRIEAGTYAVAAAITGGELTLTGVNNEQISSTLTVLRQAGAKISEGEGTVRIKGGRPIYPVNVATTPYPGFATDMQAQITALMCLANGTSVVTENIFENRFMHVPELCRMGADIREEGRNIIITGKKRLSPAQVMATDLRASVCLVLVALATEGRTTIGRVYHIDRGYERIEEKLRACGANILREQDV